MQGQGEAPSPINRRQIKRVGNLRTGSQRALEIGVERYLGKPYQEADLLRNVQETLRLSRA